MGIGEEQDYTMVGLTEHCPNEVSRVYVTSSFHMKILLNLKYRRESKSNLVKNVRL